MKRVYLADAQTEERAALRLMLLDLNLQVVGEACQLSPVMGPPVFGYRGPLGQMTLDRFQAGKRVTIDVRQDDGS